MGEGGGRERSRREKQDSNRERPEEWLDPPSRSRPYSLGQQI